MPVNPTYPGVYLEEVPSGVRTISGVSTSVTAFVGRARKGPVDEPITIFNYGDYERIFGGLWEKSPMSYSVLDFFRNGGGEAVIVRVMKGATPAKLSIPVAGDGNPDPVILEAINPGSWGDQLSATIDYETRKKEDGTEDETLYNLVIQDGGGNIEPFMNIRAGSSGLDALAVKLEQASKLVRLHTSSSDGRPIDTEQNISPDTGKPVPYTVAEADRGNDGKHIFDTEISTEGLRATKQGIYALEKTDIFNLLCIPPYCNEKGKAASETAKATDVSTGLIAAAAQYCRERRAVFLIDPHSTWTEMSAAKEAINTLTYPATNSNYTAIYFPRLHQADPLRNNQVETFVPSGAIAGIIARTDVERGVWKAPAGTDAGLAAIHEFSVSLTDKENGVLNALGINCLRSLPPYGNLVWGARTADGADVRASQWKYLPVRRTALYIEESLYRGLKWVVFEPNDEPLWSQIRMNVGAFMHNLFRQGAFQGGRKEAYFIRCDKETTTQNDIDRGIVNILVGFAPLKPAEFVIIKLQQIAGQVEL